MSIQDNKMKSSGRIKIVEGDSDKSPDVAQPG